MSAKLPFYITTAISYPNGPPHIGHAYEAIATDAIARFMRLDGYDVYFLTGTDEHGQKMQQTAAKLGLTARQLRDRNVPLFEAMVQRLECSNDDFIHTTEERHHRASKAIWEAMEKNGDIYLDKYAGWYSVRDEAYYAEDETHLNEQKVRVVSQDRHAGRVGRGGELFLPPLRLSGQALEALRAAELRAAEGAAERGRELRARRPAGSVDLAHHLRLGRQGARQRQAHHVCMGRRADQLHHRRRLSRHRQREVQALLAGGAARHRQGHRALPRRLLAGVPDVGGHRGAAAYFQPRLFVQPRREDVEVGRQRHRSVCVV